MSFRLNPVKAVCNMKKWGKNDINGINDACYGICAAFSSGDDAYNIQPECAQACKDFLERRKHEIYGVGSCDHQAPYRPVIWDNIPRFVPNLIKKGKNPKEALEIGKKMCENVPNLYNECVDLCNLDYSAIESYTPVESKASPPPKKEDKKEDNKKEDKRLLVMSILFIGIAGVLVALFSSRLDLNVGSNSSLLTGIVFLVTIILTIILLRMK